MTCEFLTYCVDCLINIFYNFSKIKTNTNLDIQKELIKLDNRLNSFDFERQPYSNLHIPKHVSDFNAKLAKSMVDPLRKRKSSYICVYCGGKSKSKFIKNNCPHCSAPLQ